MIAMDPKIKTSHGIALLGVRLILAVVFISSAGQGLGQISKFTTLVNSRSQLAAAGSGSTVIYPSGNTWTVPSDWNNSNNTIEVIGGGGASADQFGGNGRGGGGGGAYSKITNLSLTQSSIVNISVGSGGVHYSTILAPNGLTQGTGTFGPSTMKVVNGMK
jgi:hypothetical protein